MGRAVSFLRLFTLYCYFHRLYNAMINTHFHFPGRVERPSAALQYPRGDNIRVVLYLHHAVNLGYKNAVIRTPDTDILVILLYHAHAISLTIYLDMGSCKHRKLINLSDLAASLGESYCETLLGFYVFTGEDCTSSFKRKMKSCASEKAPEEPKVP